MHARYLLVVGSEGRRENGPHSLLCGSPHYVDSEFLHDTSSVALDSSYSNLRKEVLLPYYFTSWFIILQAVGYRPMLISLRQWVEQNFSSEILPGRCNVLHNMTSFILNETNGSASWF